MSSDQADIVERLGDLARFYLNEKPDVPLSQEEREEIASELSSAAAEITRLRKALAEREWKPITTVPIGEEVFLACDGSHPEYDGDECFGISEVLYFEVRPDGFIDNFDIPSWGYGPPPTHWKPIPPLESD